MADIVERLRDLAACNHSDISVAADAAEIIERLHDLVKEAYCEGFQEGKDGGWIGGPSNSWKESHSRAALEEGRT